jgi:hypothetical protein
MSVPKQVRDQVKQVKEFYEDPPKDGEAPADQNPDPNAVAPVRDPEETPPPPQDGGDSGVPDSFEQKWRSLQGSYNASMRRNSELEQRLGQMQTLIATMSTAQAAPPAPHQQQAEDTRLLSDEEMSDYGESVDVMRKVSREELTPLVQRLMQIERAVGDVARLGPQVQGIAAPTGAKLTRTPSFRDGCWRWTRSRVTHGRRIWSRPSRIWMLAVSLSSS